MSRQTPVRPPLPSTICAPRDVLSDACATAGISVTDAQGPCRRRDLATQRFHVMWLLRRAGWSYPRIGRRLNRDHTAILHGVRRWESLSAAPAHAAA